VGKLSYEDAMRFQASGPVARASGVDRDVRRDDPYLAYGEIPFNVITDNHCDVLGRTIVRAKELIESYKILRFALRNIPQGDLAVRTLRRIPAGEAFARYEAPRGEDVHYVRANGTDKPERVKLRAPTLANLASITHMLDGGYLADVPIVIAAIDPCFSCTDRSISIKHLDSGNENIMDWESLRKYSIDWHKNRGFNAKNIQLKLK
jgi:NADH-quinone oxidoreductase subunit D